MTVTLEWTATGRAFNQQVREPGMRANHRKRVAEVEGTVVVQVNGTTWTFTDADLFWGEITHYTEIQSSALP